LANDASRMVLGGTECGKTLCRALSSPLK